MYTRLSVQPTVTGVSSSPAHIPGTAVVVKSMEATTITPVLEICSSADFETCSQNHNQPSCVDRGE